MKRILSLLLIQSIVLISVQSYLIQGSIDNKKSKQLDFSQTKVILNNGDYTGFVDNMGTFNIYVPQTGLYKLDVVNLHYFFEPVLIEISDLGLDEKGNQKIKTKAYLYNIKSSKDQRLVYPLELEPSELIQYYEIEQPFNPMNWLKNPMVIMVGMTFVLMFMMKRMPKQELEQMQQLGGNGEQQMPQCAQQ